MRNVELPERARAGLLSGQTGILAVAWRLDRSDALADELYERVLENASSTATGVMWGSPGTILAARMMLDETGESRWEEAWQQSVEWLLAAREGGAVGAEPLR